MNHVQFHTTPPLGTVIMILGQRYELVNTELHYRTMASPRCYCIGNATVLIVQGRLWW